MARRKVGGGQGETPRPRPPKRVSEQDADKTSRYFDEYVNRGLHELFDGVVREPIPDSILKLLETGNKRANDAKE